MVIDGNCKFRGLFIDVLFCEFERFNCLNLKGKGKILETLVYHLYWEKFFFFGVHRVKCFVYPFSNWDTV